MGVFSPERVFAHGPARPDSHAPIGVMGDHLHLKGEWMASYRFMYMYMRGNRDHTSNVRTKDVLAMPEFMVSPKKMWMAMHMLGLMYAPTDTLTLSAMLPYVVLDMDSVTMAGDTFTTRSDGIGDSTVSGLYSLYRSEHHRLHLNAGLSVPTGSISHKDDTPMGRTRLAYPMQIGSGTWDLLPGLTYTGFAEDWSWGAQTLATLRLGENRHDYTLGNRLMLTTWIARPLTTWLSTSLRAKGEVWGNIHGEDESLMIVTPAADPDRRKGRRVDLALGLNLLLPRGIFRGHRLAVEYGFPVYQWLDGPQLETDWYVIAGWQRAF